MTPRPLITLTTDFGDGGYYVGALRGVLLSLCPDAVLVDITHTITPFSPLDGSLVLQEAAPLYPEGTVHLAVVDPGVGGLRKPIFVRSRGHWFVGPDNGLFTAFLEGAEVYRIHLPENGDTSDTFHGRDLFAPTAAKLASGAAPDSLGERTRQAVRLDMPRPVVRERNVEGQVLYPDRFGNLITNIHRTDIEELGSALDIRVGSYKIPRLSRTYDEGQLGQSLAVIGSSGFLELAVVQGSAGDQLGVGRGERVRVRAHAPKESP